MKFYNIERPGRKAKRISPDSLFLGERGRGRMFTKVNIIEDGGDEFSVFGSELLKTTDSIEPSNHCLIRVNTCGSYQRGRRYDLVNAEKCDDIVANGYFAFGGAGRVGGGEDYLIHAVPGTAFTLVGKYGQETRYHWTGSKWVVGSPSEVKMELVAPTLRKMEEKTINLSQIPEEIISVFRVDMGKMSYKSNRYVLQRWAAKKGIGHKLFVQIERQLKKKLLSEGWHFNW